MEQLPEPLEQVLVGVCQLSEWKHFWAIVLAQLILALFNYIVFTKNPNTKSATLFDWIINIIRALMSVLFKRRT